MPTISIIIPTYNRCDLLPYTLDSVLAQTYRDLEVIVMDNASTDETPALMAAYQSRDSRIRYIRNSSNVGLVQNYNLGLHHATGTFVNFLDSDDTFEPAKLAKQVRYLLDHPQIDAVSTRFYNIDLHGRRLNQTWMLPKGDLLPTVLYRYFAVVGTLLMRIEFARKMGVYDPAISMSPDWDFYLRSALSGARFGCVQELLFSYRLHQNNTTRNALAEEQALYKTLERALAHPNFPANLKAQERQARISICLWLVHGCRMMQQWDDVKRLLSEVWRLNPDLCSNLGPLLPDLRGMALSIRVPEPLDYLEGLLSHWPAENPLSQILITQIRSEVRLGYAFRLYSFGKLAEAQREVRIALSLNPALLDDSTLLDQLLIDQAISAVVASPLEFINRLFDSLPAEAQSLHKHRRRILANMRAVCAFGSFQSEQYRETRQYVLSALLSRPGLVKNRGLLSILARSFKQSPVLH